ncbi:Coiled-coil domain-containing protein 130-like protein [Hypsibius exemplaris]|uniref:Coiled-coil domain-containing protein 130-like protein n=1 Tax=Hypsibius exemplaris TaxID=2072580 RepID=A0A9X6RNE7_HYPEX|nr:Coiled-coil domain-containing protein 130-like protein [Hypsibius exemplaris]
MGERKGQNHYYPPDWRPELGGLNKFHGTHALAERANKLHLGIMVIRFEMPFNIWCEGCNNHVGMGVRYNAEKRKIGMYYTTPLWEFRMKCHLCDNYYEFRTDPKNFDYEVFSGARRQERRWDPASTEQVEATDKNTMQKLLTDPMFKLEHGKDDQVKAAAIKPVIDELSDLQSRMKDDYLQNSLARSIFRTDKKRIKLADEADQALMKKNSLSIQLLPEREEDRRAASLMKYISIESSEDRQKRKRDEIDARPVLPSSMEMQPAAAKIVRNFSFGSPGESSERLLSPLQLGIIPKRSMKSPALSTRLPITAEQPRTVLSLEDAPQPTEEIRPALRTTLVSDYGSSSDSD